MAVRLLKENTMEQFFTDYRTIIEGVAFLSTILIAMVGIIGLRQLFLMKVDINSRNDRASKEKAIDASSSYLNEYCPLTVPFFNLVESEKLGSYDGPIMTFSLNSIPKDKLKNSILRYKCDFWLDAMNKLESISAIFANGIADEKLGFQIIGRTFCYSVESNYDLISISRKGGACDYYTNIISLYKIWRPRLKKEELKSTKQELDCAIAAIKDEIIPSIDPKL